MRMISAELAELSEAESMHSLLDLLPDTDLAGLGVECARIGGGVVVSVREDPSGFWSRAVGLGFAEPVTGELIAEIREFFRARRVPAATIQIAPEVLPADWAEIRAAHGLTEGALLVKAAAPVAAIRPPERAPQVEVRPVSAEDGPRWAALMEEVFGLPGPVLRRVAEASVARPETGWHALGSWYRDELVGTAMLRVGGQVGNLFSGATLPAARGRGGQGALLRARAELARAAGADWVVSEAAAEGPGEHNSSLHNMLRAGFTEVYQRRNWTLSTGIG